MVDGRGSVIALPKIRYRASFRPLNWVARFGRRTNGEDLMVRTEGAKALKKMKNGSHPFP